ncbi:NAD(P)-binding protein [Dothidotthia symphoricarpi CBS 119687]|uniref:NAD(P)-binding protein n=1 Tax=Dothidotthia symphoricarpi CBS 119687 TaxID=1392245 RepID=A0A6A5ZY14_9PLEO|nr:NAD(P)-binding protein [Dothidotthia symphoricarpi CBS 119687]KAF2123915.1 NAD(P)-binding protein [Dothidotthia symphoricarpi CBS 119687]
MSKILLTGATGYVGGTVLTQLLADPKLTSQPISLLVRTETQAAKLRSVYGARVHPILWKGLEEDEKVIADTAAQYDIIVNAGSGFITSGAKALVDGLARRVQAGLPTPWFLHVSGCTNLVDPSQKPREWNDEKDGAAIFEYMASLDAKTPYSQRTTELTVLETAAQHGVAAVSLQAPCIFGEGTGQFNRQGLVIPLALMFVVQHGYGFKLNETANFDWVHIEDLASYFVQLVRTILSRPDRGVGFIPTGKEGILFPTVGRTLVTEINQKALDVAFAAGDLPRGDTPQQKEIRLAPVQEIADKIGAGRVDIATLAWGGEKAVRGTVGQKLLGWEPTRLQDAWDQDFEDELKALKEGRRMVTFASCVGMSEARP